jgi:hypothetical protein
MRRGVSRNSIQAGAPVPFGFSTFPVLVRLLLLLLPYSRPLVRETNRRRSWADGEHRDRQAVLMPVKRNGERTVFTARLRENELDLCRHDQALLASIVYGCLAAGPAAAGGGRPCD